MDVFIHLNIHPLMFIPPHQSQVLQGTPIYIVRRIHVRLSCGFRLKDTGWGKRCLSSKQNQVIFMSVSSHSGNVG